MKDTTQPKGKWEFNQEVTNSFEDMLKRSIPQYEIMRETVTELSKQFVQHKTDIVDLGASKGDAVDPLIKSFGAYNHFILVEKSVPMYEFCVNRYRGLIDVNVVDVKNIDLRQEFPNCQASLILSILTLMFIPVNYRQKILKQVYDSLITGGAFIIVEKLLGNTDRIDNLMVKNYHQKKMNNGYSKDSIERKSLSLEGVLVPLTAEFNEILFQKAGFKHYDCFWRWMNFAGWVLIKD